MSYVAPFRLREKVKPITDKRSARGVVESMRREPDEHGPQSLHNDAATFAQLAPVLREAKMISAVTKDQIQLWLFAAIRNEL